MRIRRFVIQGYQESVNFTDFLKIYFLPGPHDNLIEIGKKARKRCSVVPRTQVDILVVWLQASRSENLNRTRQAEEGNPWIQLDRWRGGIVTGRIDGFIILTRKEIWKTSKFDKYLGKSYDFYLSPTI